MAIRQTRIFVPPVSPFDDFFWSETLVGSVLAPIAHQAEWFWFSRYVQYKTGDSGDCDINVIPDNFGIDPEGNIVGSGGLFRSLRFRYQVSENQVEIFEAKLRNSINNYKCIISDFRSYPLVEDLGGDRFISGVLSQQRRIERADLMVKYLCDVCQLFLHALEGPDKYGKYRLEMSNHQDDPRYLIFGSAHHLFCNITRFPERNDISKWSWA